MTKEKNKPAIPVMNPYIFTCLLLGFGLWCFRDGWMNPDPNYEHALFNQVLSVVLIPWGVYDFFKIRKRQKNEKKQSED